MKNPKILYLVRWFGNYKVPVCEELVKLTNNNFHIAYSKDAVTPEVHDNMQKRVGNNAIALEGEKHLIIGSKDSNMSNSYIDIPYQPGILTVIDKVNPDIIISDGFFQWTVPAVLKSKGRKVCIFYERTAYVERNAQFWRTYSRKLIGRFADGFIINGTLTRKYLESMGFGKYPMVEGAMVAAVDDLQSSVANCADAEIETIKQKYELNRGGLTYLFVGQLVIRKGIKELLVAWEEHIKNHPNDNILVIGDGILRQELEERFSTLSSIHIIGNVNYSEIYKYYATTDVFIMPTLEDNWSLVVPEAMACGLPVATTIYNGCYVELIKEGENGYAFDSHNQDSIVDTLSKFHSDDLKKMGGISKQIVSNYTPKTAAKIIYEFCVVLTKLNTEK
ncbi:MAG: glycosyltransferase family 4 protein [Rikenellaceae bacterium]